MLISNSEHVVEVEYHPMAGRHEVLVYRRCKMMKNDNNNPFEMRQFASIARDSMNVAYLGTRLTFDPDYIPAQEYNELPPVDLRHRAQAAPRLAVHRGGRGGRRGQEDVRARPEGFYGNINLSLATLEPYYPVVDYAGASTSRINFMHPDSAGFVTPTASSYDFMQFSVHFPKAPSTLREFPLHNSSFIRRLNFLRRQCPVFPMSMKEVCKYIL